MVLEKGDPDTLTRMNNSREITTTSSSLKSTKSLSTNLAGKGIRFGRPPPAGGDSEEPTNGHNEQRYARFMGVRSDQNIIEQAQCQIWHTRTLLPSKFCPRGVSISRMPAMQGCLFSLPVEYLFQQRTLQPSK